MNFCNYIGKSAEQKEENGFPLPRCDRRVTDLLISHVILLAISLTVSPSSGAQTPTPRPIEPLPVLTPRDMEPKNSEKLGKALEALRREIDAIDEDVSSLTDTEWEELQEIAGEVIVALGMRSLDAVTLMVEQGRYDSLFDDFSETLSRWTTETISTDDINELERGLQQILRRNMPSRAERKRWEEILQRLAIAALSDS